MGTRKDYIRYKKCSSRMLNIKAKKNKPVDGIDSHLLALRQECKNGDLIENGGLWCPLLK